MNKWIGKSSTIWGIIILVLSYISQDANFLMDLFGNEWGDRLLIIIGAVLAIYGRINAKTNLTLLPGVKK